MPLPENMTRVAGGVYIVRTQAGFKRALKTYVGHDKEDRKEVEGYPTSYPCLVVFSTAYRGYHYVTARFVPLHKLRDALRTADPAFFD